MVDPLYHLAKEINFPFDAYEENPEADAERLRSKVRGGKARRWECQAWCGVGGSRWV